jgi:hypothetical protein
MPRGHAEYEKLFDDLERCLIRSADMDLKLTSELLRMALLETVERYQSDGIHRQNKRPKSGSQLKKNCLDRP